MTHIEILQDALKKRDFDINLLKQEIANLKSKDLVTYNIALHNDPCVSSVAKERQDLISDLEADRDRLDWLSDQELIGGLNGLDIDDMTGDALSSSADDPTDEQWNLERRRQMRKAIDLGRLERTHQCPCCEAEVTLQPGELERSCEQCGEMVVELDDWGKPL